MENLNEKIILAKSAGQYSNNGYPLIFEMGLGNSVEENWEDFDYSICIKAER